MIHDFDFGTRAGGCQTARARELATIQSSDHAKSFTSSERYTNDHHKVTCEECKKELASRCSLCAEATNATGAQA